MARAVLTDIAPEGTFQNQDTRSMVDQLKIAIARPAVHRALVLEYEDMLTDKSSDLSRFQCLRLGRKAIPKVRLLASLMGGLKGQRLMSTSGTSICQS